MSTRPKHADGTRILRGRGWAGIKPRRPHYRKSHSQQAQVTRQLAEAVRLRLDPEATPNPPDLRGVFLGRVNLTLSSILVNRPEVTDAQEVQWPFGSLVEIVQILRQSPADIHEAWHLDRHSTDGDRHLRQRSRNYGDSIRRAAVARGSFCQ